MVSLVPVHGGAVPQSIPLLVVVALAAVGTATLLGLAIGAFVQRQSRSYLLLVAALAALLGRSAVPGIRGAGLLSATQHHLIEHGLDVVLVALVLAAVYHARTASPEVGPRR